MSYQAIKQNFLVRLWSYLATVIYERMLKNILSPKIHLFSRMHACTSILFF